MRDLSSFSNIPITPSYLIISKGKLIFSYFLLNRYLLEVELKHLSVTGSIEVYWVSVLDLAVVYTEYFFSGKKY